MDVNTNLSNINDCLSDFASINISINKIINSSDQDKDYLSIMNNAAVDSYVKDDYEMAFYTFTHAVKTIIDSNSTVSTKSANLFLNEKKMTMNHASKRSGNCRQITNLIGRKIDMYYPLNNEARLSEAMRTNNGKVKDSLELLSIFLLNLSLVYFRCESHSFAEIVVDKSLKLVPKQCNTRVKIALLNIKGCLQYRRSSINHAQKYFEYALKCDDYLIQVSNKTVNNEYSNHLRGIVTSNIGRVHFKRKDYSKAIASCLAMVETYLSFLDDRHEYVCVGMYNLGLACEAKGELETAVKSFEYFLCNISLEICGLSISSTDLVAIFTHILIVLIENDSHGICSCPDLIFYLKKANDIISLKCFEHSMMSEYLKHIGNKLIEINLQQIALPFLLEQLRVEKQLFESQHTKTAETLLTIGLTYVDLDQLPHALECFNQILNVRNSDGSNGPLYAQALYNIGYVNYIQEYPNIAWKYFEKAINASKEVQGQFSPDIAEMLFDVARFEIELGRTNEALPKLLESLMIRRLVFGNNHSLALETMCEIGKLHELEGDVLESLNIYRQILSLHSLAGKGNEHRVIILHRVAELSYVMEKKEVSIKAYKEILDIIRSDMGCNHQSFISVLQILSSLYVELGMTEEAIDAYEQCKKISKNISFDEESTSDPYLEEIVNSLFSFVCTKYFTLAAAAA